MTRTHAQCEWEKKKRGTYIYIYVFSLRAQRLRELRTRAWALRRGAIGIPRPDPRGKVTFWLTII